MDNSNTALVFDNVSYSYKKNFLSKKVLHNISFKVNIGQAFGFIGHNGAGKTTCIKAILNFIKLQEGTIKVLGKSNKNKEVKKNIGYVSEFPYFYDHLRVNELLKSFALLYGVKKQELDSTIDDVLELVRFKEPLDTFIKYLSKGQLQRIAIAQAILHTPQLLILDEPFSGLDPIGRSEIMSLLSLLKNNGTTIFISSHNLHDVELLCDEVAILKSGVLKGVYKIREFARLIDHKYELTLFNNANSLNLVKELKIESKKQGDFITLKFKEEEQARYALKKALELNEYIESFQKSQISLEDVFFKIIEDEKGK